MGGRRGRAAGRDDGVRDDTLGEAWVPTHIGPTRCYRRDGRGREVTRGLGGVAGGRCPHLWPRHPSM